MLYRTLADGLVVVHLAFVLFVVLGGVLAWRWPRLAWVHLPAFVWGVWISITGAICPLTPLENRLRRIGGEAGYDGGFIEQYLLPVLYPGAMTREIQIGIGIGVLVWNVAIYAALLARTRRRARERSRVRPRG